MFNKDQIEHFSDRYASTACSVCRHVLEGEFVTHFANIGPTYAAGCCAACLHENEDKTTIRCDHLFSRQPELLSLLHLPVNGIAVLVSGEWKLGILDFDQEGSLIEGKPFIKRSFDEFAKVHKSLAILAIGKHGPHETSFQSGVRFVPGWLSLDAANRYRKESMYFFPRLYTRVREVGIHELQAMLIADGHNYLCIQEAGHTWECLIVNDTLDLLRNTLLLY